jgi:hypothetical protein
MLASNPDIPDRHSWGSADGRSAREAGTAPDVDAEALFAGRPAGSRIEATRQPDGLTLDFPPPGLVRADRWLFFFSLYTTASLAAVWCVMFSDKVGRTPDQMVALAALFLSISGLLAFFLVLIGRRRTTLRVACGTLIATDRDILGTRRRKWARPWLTALAYTRNCPGDSSRGIIATMVNAEPQAVVKRHTQAELEWAAAVLRRALNLPERAPRPEACWPYTDPDPPQPDASRLALEEGTGRLTLRADPPGLWRTTASHWTLVGLALALPSGLGLGVYAWFIFFSGFPVLEMLDAGMIYLIMAGLLTCVGLLAFFVGLTSGLTASDFTIDDLEVRLVERGPLGSRRRRWPRDRVATAFAGRGVAQLFLTDGRMVGFFPGQDASDVGWAVAVLRRALGLPMDAPGSCRISRTADGVTVTLPPDDIWRSHKPLIVAVLGVSLFTVWSTIRGGTLLPLIGSLVVVLPAWAVKAASIPVCLSLSVVLWRVLIDRSRIWATVTARPEGVEFRYDGLFARRARYVPREKIASIDVGSSEKDDDDSTERSGIALRLWISNGTKPPKKACYFAARSPMELRWLASLLREVLGVPRGRPGDGDERDVAGENKSGRAAGRLASSGPAAPQSDHVRSPTDHPPLTPNPAPR